MLQKWSDVEADEFDIRATIDKDAEPHEKKQWEQWGGLVERGNRETLLLTRLHPKKTVSHAPGPGPIRQAEWEQIGKKHLAGTNVILHTDGARSYKLKIPGVIHDHIVHKKKLLKTKAGTVVKRHGKPVWVKPKFAKVVTHVLPDGRSLRVKAGTQVIDRFWEHARKYLKGVSSKVGSLHLRTRLRHAQFDYWYTGQDLWCKAGEAITSLHA